MVDIINTTKRLLPKLPYKEMARAVHGTEYELSVVFCGARRMRTINRMSRGKDYATDVLSFPLSEESGEMFICFDACERKRKDHEKDLHDYIAMVFVHSLVHLKGLDHGATMDILEAMYQKQFGL